MVERPQRSDLTVYRVDLLEKAVADISESLISIRETLARYADTRESLDRAFKAIEGVSGRIATVEHAMPVLKLTSGWIKLGVVSIAMLVLAAVVKLVILS